MGKFNYMPPFLREKYEALKKDPKLCTKHGHITDFLILIECVWTISNREYQETIWVKHKDPNIIDSYDDTTMYFIEDSDVVLDARDAGRIEMTDRQYEMLKKLYEMVDAYDSKVDWPASDTEIVNDPEWHKIREYAKLTYEELIREE